MGDGDCGVFLDKDGTLIEDVPYNVDPEKVQLTAGAPEGLRMLHAAGYRLIVVSNQAGVARGYFAETALAGIEARIRNLLAAEEIPLLGFYYCPHHPQGCVPEYTLVCSCRKPQPGLLLRASQAHAIDLEQSWLIGDILDDIEAGHRAGCRAILLANGHEHEWSLSPSRVPDAIAATLDAAARVILGSRGGANR